MIRKHILFLLILGFSTGLLSAQPFVKTTALFHSNDFNSGKGQLNIIQNPSVDTLISRYILMNKNVKETYDYFGMQGYRIQIYSSSSRNAREESAKVYSEFLNKFPDLKLHSLFAQPGYYKVRAGDFRTKTEATKMFLIVSKEYPDAYLVPDIIQFPDQNSN